MKNNSASSKLLAAIARVLNAGDQITPDMLAELARARDAFAEPSGDWIRHTEAAQLLKRNADQLAQKRDGEYTLYPELTRIRREGEKFIWMLRSEVVDLITRTTEAARLRSLVRIATPSGEVILKHGRRTAAISARIG